LGVSCLKTKTAFGGHMRQSFRISWAAALFLCVNLLWAIPQAQKHEPLTEGEIIRLLQGGVAPERVGRLARESGITFEVTPAVERDLRDSGANDQLLQTLRELAAGSGAKTKKGLPKTEPPQAGTGTLLITADARCNPIVDGEAAGELAPGASKRVVVPFGEHLVHAQSSEETSVSVDWTGKVETSEQQLVQLRLADKVANAIATRKAEEAARVEQVRTHSFIDITGKWTRTWPQRAIGKCTLNWEEVFEVRPETQRGATIRGEFTTHVLSASPDTKNCRQQASGASTESHFVEIWHDKSDRRYRVSFKLNLGSDAVPSNDDFNDHVIVLTSPYSLKYTGLAFGEVKSFTQGGDGPHAYTGPPIIREILGLPK
jgi:hypothetical protein